jgi:diguanylate cyclase (GGDEF)-like protein
VGSGEQLLGTVSEVAAQIGTLMDRLALQQRIKDLAYHDSLTGLSNRTLFAERATHALALSRRQQNVVGIGMVDVNGFKQINDSLGHAIGDEVLHEVGRRLEYALREADTVARLGGDEFGILLETMADEAVEPVIVKLRAAFVEPLALSTGPLTVQPSIGFAVTRAAAADLDDLLRAADRAMYGDKRSAPARRR